MKPGRAPAPSSIATATTNNGGGVVLGKYQLGRLLGRGSFAKVYLARSLCDGSAVAIKVIDKNTTLDASRIVREVAAMRRVNNHPNILQIHEVMATKSKIYLVMELARGGELSAQLSRCRYESTARRYFEQLVSALHFCHQNGVTHRDIKPQNLLLDEFGVLKISDFGLSALSEHLHNGLLHTACGTPAYTAPEVFCRHGYDGAKADAWSCGVILFLFLAGKLPFDDSNLATMYQKICGREFQCPNWVSKPAKNIVRQLLDPNPHTRMSIETLMSHVWFKKPLQLNYTEHFPPQLGIEINRECKLKTTNMSAFDIISMSSGLDLSGFFEPTLKKVNREKRFTSQASVEAIQKRVVEVSGRLGYRVERGKGRSMGLMKGRTVLLAEILVVAPELALVVVRVVDGGEHLDNLQWDDFRVGFGDVVLCWLN